MSRDDVLSVGQLFRNSADQLTTVRVEATYQGAADNLDQIELFNLDLITDASDIDIIADLAFDTTSNILTPTADLDNSDFLMLRPLEGVLVDNINLYFSSTRGDLPNPDRIDVALGRFTVPTPGVAVTMLGALGLSTRRRRR